MLYLPRLPTGKPNRDMISIEMETPSCHLYPWTRTHPGGQQVLLVVYQITSLIPKICYPPATALAQWVNCVN